MRHQNLNKVNVLPTRQASSIQILFVFIFVLVSICPYSVFLRNKCSIYLAARGSTTIRQGMATTTSISRLPTTTKTELSTSSAASRFLLVANCKIHFLFYMYLTPNVHKIL